MIYDQVETAATDVTAPLVQALDALDTKIERTSDAYKIEDSRSRQAEMKLELNQMRRERRELSGSIEAARIEAFQNLLAEEYGIPRNHPKFDKLFSLAWSDGHSSGFSGIEGVFMNYVELLDPVPPEFPPSACVECGRKIPAGQMQKCSLGGDCNHHIPAALAGYMKIHIPKVVVTEAETVNA